MPGNRSQSPFLNGLIYGRHIVRRCGRAGDRTGCVRFSGGQLDGKSDLYVLAGLGRRPEDPELGSDGHIALTGDFRHPFGAMVDPVGVHAGSAEVDRPTTADTITQRHVEQVHLVLHLGVLGDPLWLFHVADEMTEGILPAVPKTHLPAAGWRTRWFAFVFTAIA
jgi:hypothetical protein